MITLFTDFGADDIYVGQVKAVLAQQAPTQPVVDLLHHAPVFNIESSAHLLAALYPQCPPGSVVLAVVDPGVGGARQPAVMVADGYWFVGPDNGLLAVIAARAQATRLWRIDWRPEKLSASFHGRDLFAPIAAQIASGNFPADRLTAIERLEVQDTGADLARIIYIDHYGNCLTGLRAAAVQGTSILTVGTQRLRNARTFSDVAPGRGFWYENSLGLVEIAMNRGSAAEALALRIGTAVSF